MQASNQIFFLRFISFDKKFIAITPLDKLDDEFQIDYSFLTELDSTLQDISFSPECDSEVCSPTLPHTCSTFFVWLFPTAFFYHTFIFHQCFFLH